MTKKFYKPLLSFVFSILFAQLLFAQAQKKGKYIKPAGQEDEEFIDPLVLIDSILYQYAKYVDLRDGSDSLNKYALEKYKSLFMPNALVLDEICPAFYYNDYSNPYRLLLKPIGTYCNTVASLFPSGLSVRILSLDTNLHFLNKNKVIVTMEKIIEGTTKKGLRIESHDTIEMEIIYINNVTEVKINATRLIGHMLMLDNDYDKDFIPDDNDKCVTVKALGRESGCPPEEIKPEPKKPFAFINLNIFSGKTMAKVLFNDYSGIVYANAVDFLNNQNGTPEINSLRTTGGEVGMDFYFGKKRHLGFGAGIQYLQLTGNIEKSGFDIYYKGTDLWDRDYKSHVSVSGGNFMEEKFVAAQFSVPVLLKIKGNFTKKLGFQIEAGINLILSFRGQSTPDKNIKFDYEAVYYTSDGGKNYSYRVNDDENNSWMITRTHTSIYTQGKENEYFDDLYRKGYNVGLNKQIDPTLSNQSFKYSYSYKSGLIARPSLNYWSNERTCFSLGILIMQSEFKNNYQVSEYYMTKKVGEYNTMMNSLERLKTTSVIFNLGLKYALR